MGPRKLQLTYLKPRFCKANSPSRFPGTVFFIFNKNKHILTLFHNLDHTKITLTKTKMTCPQNIKYADRGEVNFSTRIYKKCDWWDPHYQSLHQEKSNEEEKKKKITLSSVNS